MSFNPQRAGRRLRGLERWRQESLPGPYWLDEYPAELSEGGIVRPATTHLGVPLGSPISRRFSTASLTYLALGQAVLAGVPFTASCWFRADDAASIEALMWLGDKDADEEFYAMRLFSSGALQIHRKGSAVTATTGTTTTHVGGTWNLATMVVTATNDVAILLNGGGKNTSATSVAVTGWDEFSVGAYRNNGTGFVIDGNVALPAIWNTGFSDEEVWRLSRGAFPWEIRPQNLVYVGLIPGHRNDLDYSGRGYHMTPYNGPTWAAGPKEITPQPRIWRIAFEAPVVEEATAAAIVRPAIRGITVPRSSLDKNVVGKWLFKPVTGDTVPDKSGFGNNATADEVNKPTWVSTRYGPALSFVAGTDDHLSADGAAALVDVNKGSLEIFSRSTEGAVARGIIEFYVNANNNIHVQFAPSAVGRLWFVYRRDGTNDAVFVPAADFTSTWHAVMTWDTSDAVYVYYNGVETADSPDAIGGPLIAQPTVVSMMLGYNEVNPGGGELFLVKLYDRVLAAPEASQLYQLALSRAFEPRKTVWKMAYTAEMAGLAGERGTLRGLLRGLFRGV